MYLIEKVVTIKQFIKGLVSIISNYDILYYVDKSKKSDSEYLTIRINKDEYIFRIANHDLPTISYGHSSEKYAKEYYDFRLEDYEKAKEALMKIIKNNSLTKTSIYQDWIKVRKELYNDFMKILKYERTNELVDCFHIFDIIGNSSATEIKKYQKYTIQQLFDRAEVKMPAEVNKILNKYGVK